jgi:hypothetical protein
MGRAVPVVGVEDHPLREDSSEDQEDEEVVGEHNTRSRTRASGQEEEEESEGEGLSDRDEGLSEGYSSYGDDSQFIGPPNLQQLVHLDHTNCRTPCRITDSTGVKVAAICGRKVRDCKRHATRRLGATNYQYGIGYYSPVPMSRGFTGHGLTSGPYYTEDQIRAFQAEEAKEMSQHVDTMAEDVTDEEEMEELARDVRVKFPAGTGSDSYDHRKARAENSVLREALAASSGGRSKKKSPPVPVLWFGMIGTFGMRWITSNSVEAHEMVSRAKQCRIEEVFHLKADAEAWVEEEELGPMCRPRPDRDSESGSSVPEVDEKASAKANRRRKKNQVRKARRQKERMEARDEAKQRSRKADSRRPSKKRRPKSEDDSDRSESLKDSSSESSQSDSSSSSSSDPDSSDSARSSDSSSAKRSNHRRGRKKSKKASKKDSTKRTKDSKKKETNYYKFQHDDTSTGDAKRIYGMDINGLKIDKAVAPDSLRSSDHGLMYTAAVDVASLPGGWNSNKGVSEELFQESQKIAQLTSTILASTNKIKGMEIQDTTWNSINRHSLGRVKNRDDLFEFVRKLRKSKKAAFTQEVNLIQQFLYRRHFHGSFVREYVRSSLLCVISARTFRNFFDLGDAIRQLAFDHSNWDNGPAKAMLSFHSEKLSEIRQYAVSRKQLVLQVYIYLRDAHAKDFYHESMAGAMWERIARIPSTPAQAGGGVESSRCSWCTSKEMHQLFHVLGQRDQCPLKALTNKAKAKEAAKWIVDQKKGDPKKEIHQLLATALTQFE